jgi:hypothetical protein
MAKDYYKFTTRARVDKAINTLMGLVEGFAADEIISDLEMRYLATWLLEHQEYAQHHPYTEILPTLANVVRDNRITAQERLDLIWLCDNLRSREYYDTITADIQRLHAILAGIAADGQITKDELINLSDWLTDHQAMRSCWPYDEVDALITSTLADRKIDPEEHAALLDFFQDFARLASAPEGAALAAPTITGICAASPLIEFDGSCFCFTGEAHAPRDEMQELVMSRGGRVVSSVTKLTNYLVIGSAGNPCWKYACYGRKVEQAVKLRQQGHKIVLVHENDFHDAM